MSLTLTNVPRIMQVYGWAHGAALQNKWFGSAAKRYPIYASTDTTTIKMNWVLGYPGPKGLYDSIFTRRLWATENARKLLAKRLLGWGMLTGFRQTFDQTIKPPELLEAEYIQFAPYGGGYSGYSYYGSSGYAGSDAPYHAYDLYSGLAASGLNDLIAALGAFTFRVVLAGSVTPVLSGGREVTIEKVGVFVRDSFDFEGFQFLGFWNDSNNTVSATNPFSGTAVFNSTYRSYRDTYHMGGDFMVFSDLLVTYLNPPHRYLL